MKSTCFICAFFSGLLFAGFVSSMTSCHGSFEIDPAGRLIHIGKDETKNPPVEVRTPKPWETDLGRFMDVQRQVVPGDRLEFTRTISLLPKWMLEMQRLIVVRDGKEWIVARSGHYRFWALGIGLSMIPMFVWGMIAAAMVAAPPRSQNAGSP